MAVNINRLQGVIMLGSQEFKNAMAYLSSAVSVVTTQGPTGRFESRANHSYTQAPNLSASIICRSQSQAISSTELPPSAPWITILGIHCDDSLQESPQREF